MPLISRYACIVNPCNERLVKWRFLNGILPPVATKLQRTHVPAWPSYSFQSLRRTLFELHLGREAFSLPNDINLEETSPPVHRGSERYSSSDDLINALGPLGQEYARPIRFKNKRNFAYTLPWDLELGSKQAEDVIRARARKETINVKSLLALYIQNVDPILSYHRRLERPLDSSSRLDDALLYVFDDTNLRWILTHGWDVTDVMNWAWILTAENTERAAMRMTIIAQQGFLKVDGVRAVPPSILLFLLRRNTRSARALKQLLLFSWQLMGQSESAVAERVAEEEPFIAELWQQRSMNRVTKNPIDDSKGLTERVFIVMIIRLLRWARETWPAACENIVNLLCQYLDGINFREGSSPSTILTPEDVAELTFAYNGMLKMLALPASSHPFQSSFFQQRAQFDILRRMNRFEPPLTVDRRGFQAIVTMQLMHKKTLKEREWAHMKAKSWPPWKEEKLGIDAHIGIEHGTSRAKEALNRAREAGYSGDEWDAAAGILSGWDTDGSPTIQTRHVHHSSPNVSVSKKATREGILVWTARVQATRTLAEAWSCFLSYRDQQPAFNQKSKVYHAMFEKIVWDVKRLPTQGHDSSDAAASAIPLAGDGKELLPAPISPRETIYLRTPPPNMDEFFDIMKEDGIRPTGRFLASMLMNATSFEVGLKYLEWSSLPREQVSALFDPDAIENSDLQAALEAIPSYFFAAIIRFLVLFAPRLPDQHEHRQHDLITTGLRLELDNIMWSQVAFLKTNVHPEQDSSASRTILINPLSRAFELLLAKKPRYRPSWYHVLRALSRPKAVINVASRFADQNFQDVETWQMMRRLVDQMLDVDIHLDLDGFLILCTGLEKMLFASEKLLRLDAGSRSHNSQRFAGSRPRTEQELNIGLQLVKEIFKDTVRSTHMQQTLPSHLVKEKSDIEERVEETAGDSLKDVSEHDNDIDIAEPKAFLPPACLLPKLLEVPGPAHLHAFVRILGLRRDYAGLLDLLEWMSLFADEIHTLVAEAANGERMMRRCLIATCVFLERSWMEISPDDPDYERAGHDGIVVEAEPAPVEIMREVREIVRENKRWGGWPTDEEVVEYCANGRFL